VKGELDKAVEDLKAEGGEDDGECPDFEGGVSGGGGSGLAAAGVLAGAAGAGSMGGMGGAMPPGMDMSKAAEMMKDPNMVELYKLNSVDP
jgi:hypothetical protein